MFYSLKIIFRLWLTTALIFALGVFIYISFSEQSLIYITLPVSLLATLIGSIPGFIILLICLRIIGKADGAGLPKPFKFLLCQFFIALLYALPGGLIFSGFLGSPSNDFLNGLLLIIAILFSCTLAATLVHLRKLAIYFSPDQNSILTYSQYFNLFINQTNKTSITMETNEQTNLPSGQSNRILIKGLLTGGLILLMLIPTIFIQNLITERQARQKEVVKEVSNKWASAQTLSGPFLAVPYSYTVTNTDGKTITAKTNILLLPKNLKVQSEMTPEKRKRSIYKVLLYKSTTDFSGAFNIKLPQDIIAENLDFAHARICVSLSDFKGIEEEVNINFKGEKLLLGPGLPVNDFGSIGLSAPVEMSLSDLGNSIPFQFQMKLKGSEQLHFLPLSATSVFKVQSAWPSPSFDGNLLPAERSVTDKGFTASWSFNRANLPFGTVIRENTIKDPQLAFGVSLVQPASQYDKTSRSVKYAILFIGLTFAFFFIIELMQRKPFHPVQYVLVGLALVIFYTLLLAISEYILFDYAYWIAALATILLITTYADAHFRSWKTAAIFFGLLSALYGFIFVLISLEDTALIVGSVGLFIILVLAMYASRKINWYGNTQVVPAAINS